MKKAFTLAEVLITLVIIGVVAAITVPTLANRAKYTQYRSAAYKALSLLNQAVEKYYVEYGVRPECGYSSEGSNKNGDFTDCKNLHDFIVRTVNIAKYCPTNAYTNGCVSGDYRGVDSADIVYEAENGVYGCSGFNQSNIRGHSAFVTADGMIFILYKSGSSYIPIYIVDLNGEKGPNRYGIDMHFFTAKFDSPTPKNDISGTKFYPGGYKCTFYEHGGIRTEDLMYKSSKYQE